MARRFFGYNNAYYTSKLREGRENFFRAVAGREINIAQVLEDYPSIFGVGNYTCILARQGARQTAAQATAYARRFGLPVFVYCMVAELQNGFCALLALDRYGRIWQKYLPESWHSYYIRNSQAS